MLPVPFGGFRARQLTAVANNANLPTTISASTSWVHFGRSRHIAPGGARHIRIAFSNWYLLTNGEHTGYYDFYISGSVLYKGVYYQLTFNGASRVLVSANFGNVLSDPLVDANGNAVVIQPGDTFSVNNTRVAADNGASGSYNALVSFAGAPFRQDGGFRTNTNSPDYSTGAGIVADAVLGPLTPALINPTSGALTPPPILSGGGPYASAPSVYEYCGAAGAGNPGALVPGSGLVGYGNLTSGAVSSITFSNSGALHSASNPPQIFLDGGNTYGITTAYGPSAIIGESLLGTPGIVLIGDSITAGFGSVDAYGDINGSWGWYEQLLATHYGVQKMAVSGESAEGWVQNKANQIAFLAFLASYGYSPEYVCVALVTNDMLTNLATNALTATQGFINGINNAVKAVFPTIKRIATTCLPCNKSTATTARFTTVAEQIPYNANFTVGGNVDLFNADLRNNAGAVPHEYLIDGNIVARDQTTTSAWRVDAYPASGATAYCNTADGSDANGPGGATEYYGIHPIPAVGIAHLVKTVTVPKLAPAPYSAVSVPTQQAAVGQAFSFAVPGGSIADTLGGQAISWSATLADGSPLPSWLAVNASTGTLSGTPTWQNRAKLSVRLIGKNTAGRSGYLTVPIWVDSGLAFISKLYVRSDNTNQLTLTGTNNQISKWSDASGNGFDLTQNTVLRQPQYEANVVDGHGAIRGRWDGTNASQLTHSDNPLLKYTTFAAFTVFRRWADLGANELIAGKFAASFREFYQSISASDFANSYLSANATGSTLNALPDTAFGALALNATYVMETGYDGTNNYIAVNGNTIYTSAFAGPIYQGTEAYTMFSDDTSFAQPSAVDVFEHAFIPGGITSTQRTAILSRIFAEFPSIAHPATY